MLYNVVVGYGNMLLLLNYLIIIYSVIHISSSLFFSTFVFSIRIWLDLYPNPNPNKYAYPSRISISMAIIHTLSLIHPLEYIQARHNSHSYIIFTCLINMQVAASPTTIHNAVNCCHPICAHFCTRLESYVHIYIHIYNICIHIYTYIKD